MSLYANLLNPKADASASISGAPIFYDSDNKDDAAAKKEANPGMSCQLVDTNLSEDLAANDDGPHLHPSRSLALSTDSSSPNQPKEAREIRLPQSDPPILK